MPIDTIDPLNPRYALQGRIVTMDDNSTVLNGGKVYIEGKNIVAVLGKDDPVPPALADVPVIKTQGTIFPGLIELHNHLSYNVLKLWNVPKQYTNRNTWAGIPDYRKLISGPMNVLGKTAGYVQAVVRYVECKCLLGGVTTSQGIALFSSGGIQKFYKGITRNVEDSGDPDLHPADGHIADVEAASITKFRERLEKGKKLLLHLSEGSDLAALSHFTDLLDHQTGEWAITEALVGIHCVALDEPHYAIMKVHGGSMVWSPLSNLLLYGQTARVEFAAAHDVTIGLGSDWSPSGSKNLLGELKVAWLVSKFKGSEDNPLFSDEQIVAMATRNAAKMLGWDAALGSIEANKRADLLVIKGQSKKPYQTLIEARETDIRLVTIAGTPRYGVESLMNRFGPGTEKWTVGGENRVLNLAQEDADPVVGGLTLQAARDKLQDGLHRLPQLALALEQALTRRPGVAPPPEPEFTLVLDQEEPDDTVLRTYFTNYIGLSLSRSANALNRGLPLSEIVEPLELDPLTVADDPDFLVTIEDEDNLPKYVKEGLKKLYG